MPETTVSYVTWDYENPGPDGYWHIFTLDNEPNGVVSSVAVP